ncbi:hypothetical protein [Rhodoblastus sp.]|uniref:hypothetical protein n=1 Tax=Rhodoblastus sp. TaxID=1962975 RepID=UPI003F9B4A3B
MKLLKERSSRELNAALGHLDEIIEHVVQDMETTPGPGWEAILDLLRGDRDEIEQELNQRGDT